VSFNILYANDPKQDLLSLLTYIDNFTKAIGEEAVVVDDSMCLTLLRLMRQDFPHVDGLEKANVFKKVAHFMCYFIGERPIHSAFSKKNIGDIAGISNHQNAIVALQIAIDSLHGAEVRADSDNPMKLENRIKLSAHSYIDVIDAISNVTMGHDFNMLTVFLEQLAYKTNPECQYEIIDI